MKYEHIARAVVETPWAILDSKLDEIIAILEFHMNGGKFSAEELRARIGESKPAKASAAGAVALIPLQGVIAHRMGGMDEMSGGISTERFSSMFRQAMADPGVSAILIDINSPGGTVEGVTELANEIMDARGTKRIVAQANSLAASAAYWIAAAADEIVSTPSGSVGSIGVITAHIDTSKADAELGITRTVIAAGKYKAEGWGPLTDEARAARQDRVNQAYAMFVKDIAKGRGVAVSDVRAGYGEGRLLTAKDALAAGMIDRIATMDQTIARMTGRSSSGAVRARAQEPADPDFEAFL